MTEQTASGVSAKKVTFTRAGCWLGLRITIPVGIAAFAFGAAFGALAAQKSMTWIEALFMSMFVFAGASQMAVLDMWAQPLPILTMAIVVSVVNSRMVLMSASIQPWLSQMPVPWKRTRIGVSLLTLTDASWALAMQHHSDGGRDLGVFLGSNLFLYIIWAVSTFIGFGLGSLISDPKTFALDLVLPTFFAIMLIPMCQKRALVLPTLVALACALTLSSLMDGYGYLVPSALAGSLTAFLTYKETS